MTPHRPALVVHTFFPAGRATEPTAPTAADPPGTADAGPTAVALEALWRGVASLDMDTPIAGLPLDLAKVRGCGPDGLEVLAARQRVVPGAFYEALAYRLHDVVGVSVLLAPNDDGFGWRALHERWMSNAPASSGAALGTVAVYMGLSVRRGLQRLTGRTGGPEARAERLRRHLPRPSDDPNWMGSWCRTAGGLLVWELPVDEVYGHRRLLVMGDAADEPAMDRWTWLSDGRALPPLTRYLLHAAKLRYQERILAAAMPRLRAAVEKTERACDTLADLLRTPEPSERQLRAAARDLGTVQAEQGGLITASADAGDMAATVRAARHNMDAALGPGIRCRPGGPFDRDQELAAWLAEQLHIELTYVDSALRKADQLTRLAAAVVDDRHRRRQEALTLFQASVLGSLLMALAAVQSLQYKVPLPGSLVAPLVCVLATVALVLPAGVLHWPRRGGPAPRMWRFVAGGAAAGAGLGWLAASVRWWVILALPAPPAWSMRLAAAGAVLAGLAAWVLVRLHRTARAAT
jgi:hypothetical protein